jgi:glycosyltransferase involved in cell wall biosynthesis
LTQWECIIVNDGSTDDTENISSKWVRDYEQITYFKNENKGMGYARNFGISKAKGDYILALDADDIINPQYLVLAWKKMQENPNLGVVYCKARKFGKVNKEWDLPKYDYKSFLVKNSIFCPALFLKEDWTLIGGYDESMIYGFEDWEFWIRLISTTKKEVFQLDYVGFNYRIKESSMLVNLFKDKERKAKILEYMNQKHADIYENEFPSKIQILQQLEQLKEENLNLKHKIERIRKIPLYKFFKKLFNL